MKQQSMYRANIDRDINGVIQVAQKDEKIIEQELREYVVTKELRRHFNTFLNNYEKSMTAPTNKIGVWISGFFGSGKSHFLKILSYLLSNDIVAGKHAVDYFADKFDDPMMFAQLERCAGVPTDTILFNIDSKGPINKDNTAMLKVFAKVFYEYRGFYGDDLKVARLEQYIEKAGKTEEFKRRFQEIHGEEWEKARVAFSFFEDDVVDVLTETLGMSETAARNWFNGTETAEMSIEQLVKEIKEYVDSQGNDFRLLFMIDEVGQYIGSDGSLMLNLQTIVEEIGSRCGGRVWVMVTSQEALDSITKIRGDDFSKIQGRFDTRLSLTSSSVDEVIKKRLLIKTDDAAQLLKMIYLQNSAVMKNLFTFNNSVLDIKGYSDEYDFEETYPFVPYQFRLMQNVFSEIRKHGNAGKHQSMGERSMLSGFQEAAQAIENKDEYALIPFSQFYDPVHTSLDSVIRRVIDRCQDAADNYNGVEQYDVDILKLLYLIRYVNDVKANLDNITTLMVDDIRVDKIDMRRKIQDSLDRLVSQNYVSRNGDTYTFLTDDEQDIEREIRNIPVDSATIIQSIAQIIYGDLYVNKKFRYGKYDFPYDQLVDEAVMGQLTGAIRLRFVTVASDLFSAGQQQLIMKSGADNEAIIVLSDKYPYFDDLEQAAKIRKYVKSRNVSQLPEAIQNIIRNKQQQASSYEKNAKGLISSAILEANTYVAGEMLDNRAGNLKDKIDTALSTLVDSVYTKLDYITHNYNDDNEIREILTEKSKQLVMGGTIQPDNPEAFDEVKQYLELQHMKMLPTSMGDIQKRFSAIPYGWREIDIAATVADLVASQAVTIQYSGSAIQPSDRHLPDYLRRKSETDKTVVLKRIAPSDDLIKKTRALLKDYFNTMDVPSDEDGLIEFITSNFTTQRDMYQKLLDSEYTYKAYPDKSVVENGISLLNDLMAQKKDNTALLSYLVEKEYDLLDLKDDMESVLSFFNNQKPIYDDAVKLLDDLSKEKDYLQTEQEAIRALNRIDTIIKMPKPYSSISEIPGLMQEIKTVYDKLLDFKKQEVISDIQSALGEVRQTASMEQQNIVEDADTVFGTKKEAAMSATNLTQLDAMKIQISNTRQQYLRALVVPSEPDIDTVTASRSSISHTAKLENEEDIDKYVSDIKDTLKEMLDGHDVLHII